MLVGKAAVEGKSYILATHDHQVIIIIVHVEAEVITTPSAAVAAGEGGRVVVGAGMTSWALYESGVV